MTRRKNPRSEGATAPLDLALQGGGSHGAFTWGVLDRLLEDEGIPIDGVSGTSAGALNAAVMATGLAEGGRAGAREALRAFWHDVAATAACFGGAGSDAAAVAMPWQGLLPAPFAEAWGAAAQAWWQPMLHAMTHSLGQSLTHSFSPYQFNPLDLNPLRDVLARHVREASLKRTPVRLFVTATAVRTGRPRVFHREDLTLDALLASACLPQLFKAVMIDGQPYWDGGYSGNPALWPLIYETRALDLLLVRVNPLLHGDLPDTALEIHDRLNEITFNEVLIGEMRAIHFVQKLVGTGRVRGDEYKCLRLHMIGDDEHLGPLDAASKLSSDGALIGRLFDWGRAAADGWLAQHRAAIGVEGTLDIEREFLDVR